MPFSMVLCLTVLFLICISMELSFVQPHPNYELILMLLKNCCRRLKKKFLTKLQSFVCLSKPSANISQFAFCVFHLGIKSSLELWWGTHDDYYLKFIKALQNWKLLLDWSITKFKSWIKDFPISVGSNRTSSVREQTWWVLITFIIFGDIRTTRIKPSVVILGAAVS